MGISTKVLTLTIVLVNSIFLAYQQTTPQERCAYRGNGSTICYDCFRTGTCVEKSDGSFSIENIAACPSYVGYPTFYCDDSAISLNYGLCNAYDPIDTTKCSCSSLNNCVADPNNPKVILHCESDPPTTDPPCPTSVIDFTTCTCLSCSDAETCPLVDDPSDDCAKYYVCSGTELIPYECSGTSCFDQGSCGCVENELTSSTELPTTLPLSCPVDCPLVDDPDDDCGNYFVCSGNELIPVVCPGTLCFEQASCGCVEKTQSSTELPTTSLTCPADCPFIDDPNDSCGSYFVCSGTDLVQLNCTGTLCFDQASCGCIEKGPLTTLSSCLSDCPFLDDLNDNCGKFYICEEDSLTAAECPGVLCFNQEECLCQ